MFKNQTIFYPLTTNPTPCYYPLLNSSNSALPIPFHSTYALPTQTIPSSSPTSYPSLLSYPPELHPPNPPFSYPLHSPFIYSKHFHIQTISILHPSLNYLSSILQYQTIIKSFLIFPLNLFHNIPHIIPNQIGVFQISIKN